MNRWPLQTLAALLLAAFAASCSEADTQRRDQIAGRLVGTWLEETEADAGKMRLVVTLNKGGTFQQAVRVIQPNGAARSEVTTGEWFFDGETFKRRYLTVNGNRVSGIQFASYQFISLTDSELACVDDLTEGKRKVTFRRVPDGTVP